MLYTDKYYKHYYVIAYKSLLYATHQLNTTTGDLIAFSDKAKLFYLHMLEQYTSYHNANKPYYETQDQLGKMFGVSDQQAYRVVNQLKELNLISVNKEGHRRYITTVYTLDQLPAYLNWVNTKLDENPIQYKKEKITSDQFLANKDNRARWEQLEKEVREEKRSPYINHKKDKQHRIAASLTEYKEFQQWKIKHKDTEE